MPQLVKLHNDYKDQGFSVVATHVQQGSQREVADYLRSVRAKFTVTSFGKVPQRETAGIPDAILFNRKGEIVASGHPMELKDQVIELMRTEPHMALGGKNLVKLAKYGEAIKRTENWAPILSKLKKEVKDEKNGKEAKFLAKRLLLWGKGQLDEAKALESTDAFASMTLYDKVARNFKDFTPGDAAKKRLSTLKKDKEFQIEVKAGKAAAVVRNLSEQLVAVGGRISIRSSANKKTAAKIRANMKALMKKYGDTNAVARLKDELSEYGFDF